MIAPHRVADQRTLVSNGRCSGQFVGVSKSRLYELLHDGTTEGKVVAGRRVIMVASLLRLVGEALSAKRVEAAA